MTLVKNDRQETKNTARDGSESASRRIEAFLLAHRAAILLLTGIIIIGAIGAGVFFAVSESITKNGLEQLDEISLSLTGGDGYAGREETALSRLDALTAKKGIVGARANMLLAEIHFNGKRYADSRGAWLKAAECRPASYIAPLSWYNAAVCSEELEDADEAFAYYEKAGAQKDFALKTHALFNAGRVKDEKADYEGAGAKYQELNDNHAGDSLANLAMSRLITLRAEGKIQ
jgi:tetratricopeptide (TPR) repeat protein